jgi:hypothetical protein
MFDRLNLDVIFGDQIRDTLPSNDPNRRCNSGSAPYEP